MTIRNLPAIKAFDGLSDIHFEPDGHALAKWNSGLRAAVEGDDNVISIYDVIGEDFWTGEGITAKRVAGALRKIGAKDVTVNINSPGGDFFEGVAIYNLLREHPHEVTVKIMGLAASAASVIAMAGDQVQMAQAGFMMVHNAWAIAIGNRHDLRVAAETLEPFDDAMADVYAARSGADKAAAVEWMDNETWFNGKQAVENGLADDLLPSDQISEEASAQAKSITAVRRIDGALANQGMSRSERRSLIAELKCGKPGAAVKPMPGAGSEEMAAARSLIETLRS